jgi:hypothetical protein
MRCGLADPGHDRAVPVLGAFDDDRFGDAEPVADRCLEFRIGARRRHDGRANDLLLDGPLEHSRHRGLRDTQVLCDLGLADTFDVIHLGDAGNQPEFVYARHAGRSPWRGSGAQVFTGISEWRAPRRFAIARGRVAAARSTSGVEWHRHAATVPTTR